MTTEQAPICPACQTPMLLRAKGEDKFWGCPNYRECGGKTIPYLGYKNQKKMPIGNDGMSAINKRLDNLAQYLAECHDEVMTKLIDIERK